MATNAPFTNAEGSQQLKLKRKVLLKTMLYCTESSCLHKLSNTLHKSSVKHKLENMMYYMELKNKGKPAYFKWKF